MSLELVSQELPRIEGAQHRFLLAVLAESAPMQHLDPSQKQEVLARLGHYFSDWMQRIEETIDRHRYASDGAAYVEAYASWLEHLSNVRLSSAIRDEVFDTFERPFDEEIALRARLFRAVAMNYAEWPKLLEDFEPKERGGSDALHMINRLRGFFDRRTVTTHMAQQLHVLGFVGQGGWIAPVAGSGGQVHSKAAEAKRDWERGRREWNEAMQADSGVQAEDQTRVSLLLGRMQELAETAGSLRVPVDILEAIRERGDMLVRLLRRRMELEARLGGVKPEEKLAFESGYRSLVTHLQTLQAEQKVLLEIRDVLEVAVELGAIASIRLPTERSVREVFSMIRERI